MNVADVITRHAAATPGAPAVIEGGRTWSYREFDAAIDRAAAGFLQQGIAPGEMVGVTLPDSALHLVAGYALARIGAVQLTLASREPRAMRDALAKRFGAKRVVGEDVTALEEWLETGANAASPPAARFPGGDAPWKIALTSGTTGAPKAVLQTHAMHIAWRELYQAAIPGRSDDRYLAVVGLDFFAGFRQCMDVHWAGGATVVNLQPQTTRQILTLIAKARITYLFLTPVHLYQIVLAVPGGGCLFPALRVLRVGAMAVPEDLRRQVLGRLTPNLVVSYGTNDVGSPLTLAAGETLARFPDSVGVAAPGIEVQIADDAGNAKPAGEAGHVRVRAPAMPQGYAGNAEASARGFRDGWYYPGDLGMLSPEGALYLKGRVDDLMNFDGIKIYPSEIESVLRSHPDVTDAAAFGLPSGKHQHFPVAAVAARGSVGAAELRRYCKEKLGARAPQRIAVMKALPRTAAGKLDKPRLVRLVQEKPGRGR